MLTYVCFSSSIEVAQSFLLLTTTYDTTLHHVPGRTLESPRSTMVGALFADLRLRFRVMFLSLACLTRVHALLFRLMRNRCLMRFDVLWGLIASFELQGPTAPIHLFSDLEV